MKDSFGSVFRFLNDELYYWYARCDSKGERFWIFVLVSWVAKRYAGSE